MIAILGRSWDLKCSVFLALLILPISPALAQPGDLLWPLPPDYSQVRAGLPANSSGTEGGAYCGPTATADLLKWMHENGFPNVGTWADDPPGVTAGILSIGVEMSTDADGGTKTINLRDGLQSILDDAYPDEFYVSYVGRGSEDEEYDSFGRDFTNIIFNLELGDMVIARIGWYHLNPPAPTGEGRRCSGHYVAITGYDQVDGEDWVRFLDPARNEDCAFEIPPCVGRWETTLESLVLQDHGQTPTDPFPTFEASKWHWQRGGNSCSNDELRTPVQDGFVRFGPVRFYTIAGFPAEIVEFNLASDLVSPYESGVVVITSIAIDPSLRHIYHCGIGIGAIFKTSLLDNSVEQFETEVALVQPRRLAFGSNSILYVLHGPVAHPVLQPPTQERHSVAITDVRQPLSQYGRLAPPGFELLALQKDGSLCASRMLSGAGDFAYHDKEDRVYWWDGIAAELHVFTANLEQIGTPIALPVDPSFAEPAYVVADPTGDMLYYNHDGSSVVFRFDLNTLSPVTPISDPELIDPAGMLVNERGQLFVAQETSSPVLQFDANGSRVQGSPAAGFSAEKMLAMRRSPRRPIHENTAAADLDNDSIDEPPTGIVEDAGRLLAVPLLSSYPNPFNPTAKVRFVVQSAGFVNLRVYDIAGHPVRRLVRDRLEAGPHEVAWNGRDDLGRRLPTGVYIFQLEVGGNIVASHKCVILR